MTGLVSESIIRLNTINSTQGKFIYFSYPLNIILECGNDPDNVTFEVLFRNIGNLNITERIEIHVVNSSYYTVASYYDDTYNLSPSDTRNFTVSWKPSKGTYLVIANASYNSTEENKTEVENHSFVVRAKEGIGVLQRFPGQIVDTIPPGRTKTYPSGIQLWLEYACNNTTAVLNKTQGIPGKWVNLSQDKIYLIPDVLNSTDLNITIPPLTPKGVYNNGTIFVYADNQRVDIGLDITVDFIDFILNTTVQKEKVCQGSNVNVEINITKILPLGDVNVNMTYQIIDQNLTVYNEEKDYNVHVGNESVQKLVTLPVSSSTKEGHYIFLVTLDYNSALTTAYDTFEVISCPTTTTIPGGGGGGGGAEIAIKPKLEARKIILNLSADTLTVITGNKTSFIATVKNIGTETVKSVKISIEGIPSEWIRIFPMTTDLDVDETEVYNIIIEIPYDATTGIYRLKVKAVDDAESNTVILTLIIGKDQKEVTELLLKELESVRAEAKRSLKIENCINITSIKNLYQDAELAFEKGMREYESKNYEGAVNWFEYALPIEKKVLNKADITLQLEVETLNKSKTVSTSVIPTFYRPEVQLQLVGKYLQEKNYEKICDPILQIRRLIFIGLTFWFLIVILFVVLVIIILKLSRRKRKEEYYKEPDLIVPPTS
jgi:hypothetical protein